MDPRLNLYSKLNFIGRGLLVKNKVIWIIPETVRSNYEPVCRLNSSMLKNTGKICN